MKRQAHIVIRGEDESLNVKVEIDFFPPVDIRHLPDSAFAKAVATVIDELTKLNKPPSEPAA